MTIRFSHDWTFYAGRFLPTLALLAACIPALAQQPNVSAPLSADEVLRRVVQMNEQRSDRARKLLKHPKLPSRVSLSITQERRHGRSG
jgi:hypothetical protein